VEGAHGQVAGFGKGDGVFHGFPIPDFPDQDHVRGLAQGVFQGRFPGIRIHPHFPLGDDAVPVLMDIFHRVFDGNDVAVGVFVAVTDHGCQGGGFPRARAPHEEHQPPLGHGYVLQNRRQAQGFQGRNGGVDGPADHPDAPHLNKGIDPETADTGGGGGGN